MKRVLLEVDRERSSAAKLQKELDQVRRTLGDQAELHRQQALERQQQLEGLHQRCGELEGRVAELQEQRDQLTRDLDRLRLRTESARPGPAAAGSTRPGKRSAGAAKPARLKQAP